MELVACIPEVPFSFSPTVRAVCCPRTILLSRNRIQLNASVAHLCSLHSLCSRFPVEFRDFPAGFVRGGVSQIFVFGVNLPVARRSILRLPISRYLTFTNHRNYLLASIHIVSSHSCSLSRAEVFSPPEKQPEGFASVPCFP